MRHDFRSSWLSYVLGDEDKRATSRCIDNIMHKVIRAQAQCALNAEQMLSRNFTHLACYRTRALAVCIITGNGEHGTHALLFSAANACTAMGAVALAWTAE